MKNGRDKTFRRPWRARSRRSRSLEYLQRCLQPFDDQGGSASAAVAYRGAAQVGVLALQYREQGNEDACSGGSQRVPQRNPSAEDIDPVFVQFQQAGIDDPYHGERFIDLPVVDVLFRQSGSLQGTAGGQRGGGGEIPGRLCGIGVGYDPG